MDIGHRLILNDIDIGCQTSSTQSCLPRLKHPYARYFAKTKRESKCCSKLRCIVSASYSVPCVSGQVQFDWGQRGMPCATALRGACFRRAIDRNAFFFKLRNFMENTIAVWMQPQIWSKLTFFLYPFQSNLFVAALSRCLQWLVEHGADTTTPDLNGNTPQQLLGAGDHSDVAYRLMDLWGGSELPPFPNSRSQLKGSDCNWQGCDSDGWCLVFKKKLQMSRQRLIFLNNRNDGVEMEWLEAGTWQPWAGTRWPWNMERDVALKFFQEIFGVKGLKIAMAWIGYDWLLLPLDGRTMKDLSFVCLRCALTLPPLT